MSKIYNLKINMHPRVCMHEHFDLLIIKPFKYKCEALNCYVCCNIY